MKASNALGLLLICAFCVSVGAQTYPQVSIPGTQEHMFYSEIMDYEYGVYVTLPDGYNDNPERIYPTLYIIDGNQFFVFTFEPYRSMVWGNMIKEHIAISVAYPPGKENMRSRDFYCTNRAADFVKFFQNELIPYVESHYRTSHKDRTLFGHSLGGHFTLYMLLNASDTFENYIACAPAVTDEILNYEKAFAAEHDDFPVKLFLVSGEDDHLTIGAKKFSEQFKTRHYPSLKYDELYTINGNHGTVQPSAYIEGLRFVLDPAIELAPEKFQRLVGTYVDGGNTFTVSYNGGSYLSLDIKPENPEAWDSDPLVEWSKIYPASETSFFSKGWSGNFEFGGDLSEPAETLAFKYRDKDIEAARK